ncbi:MAG: hypothetical protein NHB32_14030 [Fischerella sp. CENA71]|nr:hypothetical protein [Fischerella sp. CENA71]
MTQQEGWTTDTDGERVYIASSASYPGSWDDRSHDTSDRDYVYDESPTVYTSRPTVNSGAYWDEQLQTLVVANPAEMTEHHQRYIEAQMKAQARAALGINPNRYDGTMADDVLTGEITTPGDMGYDPLNVHRLINSAGNDEEFQQYLESFDPTTAESQVTPQQAQVLARIQKQFGTKFQNSNDPGRVNRKDLLAFASYYGILPKQEQQQAQQQYLNVDQSNIPESLQLKGMWGVDDSVVQHRVEVVDQLLQLAGEAGKAYATVEGVYRTWDAFARGGYDKQLKALGREDLISKRNQV